MLNTQIHYHGHQSLHTASTPILFITYFYNDSKIIIFEETNNLEYNNRYENESIYFVKESEGK